MNIMILNGSPIKKGTVAKLLKGIESGIDGKHTVEWIDIYDQRMQPCIACMKSGQVLTKKFVARLRKRYLPEKYDKEIAGHRQSAACLDTDATADKVAGLLGCNVKEFKKLSRVSGPQKEKRDLIVY